ncbi:unnamed protein product [Adineta steineri]|uniref:Uncharacterized protein n=1 Tax=Adineta steineri TaxID=433720 RepID=A0A819SF71_9BILA|nr:unnamed protein product [Adineta steineri]
MSSISQYELLKQHGTFQDRLKYVLSLEDKNEIENYLRQSLTSSYDDLQMFVFLSTSTKNQKNLLEIIKIDSLPIKQRTIAAQSWIQLEKDEKQIFDFIIENLNDKNMPRYFKYRILQDLHRHKYLKKSSTFFYSLASHLTETYHHSQYNIDAHLLPFCTKDQIFDLLSRWSLKRLEQISCTSALIRYQPRAIIDLIRNDLKEKKSNHKKFRSYFRDNNELFKAMAKKQPKELVVLAVEYLNQLEKHERLVPNIIESKKQYFFKKAPNEMIELITIVASNQPGVIKYQSIWSNDEHELGSFSLPRSFSIKSYVELFSVLYDKCQWSSCDISRILQCMLNNDKSRSNLNNIKKERKWFIDIVINKFIGKDIFIERLKKEGDESILKLLELYPELTTPLSAHLISQLEKKGIVEAGERLSFIRHQIMTQEVFDEFLSLFKQTSSDVNQRYENYPLFFQCAVSTNAESVNKVLLWIEKRLTNEALYIIEEFLRKLKSANDIFQLEMLPNNFESIENIIDMALNHLDRSDSTLEIIMEYGQLLLQRAEHYQNKTRRKRILGFATSILKKCYSYPASLTINGSSISELYPKTRNIIADILVADVYPQLVSKYMLTELNTSLKTCLDKAWRLPQIDIFINRFFTKTLPSSPTLQSVFPFGLKSTLVSYYIKNRATRFERVNYLINKLDKLFFLNPDVQKIAVRSQQHRQFIDQLIQDDKCVTAVKILKTQLKQGLNLKLIPKKLKLPGLHHDILWSLSYLLTGKQQEHIIKIILDDYFQDKEIGNYEKLASFRILRRLTHTYNITLEWFNEKQDSALSICNSTVTKTYRNRGAAAKPLDDIIICLPSTFDLTPQLLLQHFDLLLKKLNASNAKYVSDAILSISRRIPDEIFLEKYLDFIQNEQFQKLGTTANKELLRLLVEFVSNTNLVKLIIKPIWNNHPHQDIRACLILSLFHFIGKIASNEEENIIWEILEEAAKDEYLPVVQKLFINPLEKSRCQLSKLKNSSEETFERFVKEIQFKVLSHPTSLEARLLAWSNIDYEYCDKNKLVEKGQEECAQFDIEGNTLWEKAFEKIISIYKQEKTCSFDIIIDIIKKIMSRREEIDLNENENGNDAQHDLPVYHRIEHVLAILNSHMTTFNKEKKITFRSITSIVLQFDKTLAYNLGIILIRAAENKEDLEDILKNLEENLPKDYFERILTELSDFITNRHSCSFIDELNANEKLELAQWFIKEKKRILFVFKFLLNLVFHELNVDREECKILLRQMRQSDNLFIRREAMNYTVPWTEDGSLINRYGYSGRGCYRGSWHY